MTVETRPLGPVQVKIARGLARCHDRGNATRWYWETAAHIAAVTRIPRRRVVHYLDAFASADLIDRHDDDGWVTYHMRAAFAATLYDDQSCV